MLVTQALVIVAAALFMAGLYAFVMLSKTGKAMRAVSEDKQTAQLMGIDVDRIITTTFALGGALAGAAGVLYALIFGQVQFYMGFVPGIKAFTAAVLGGIGNVPGAMVGGLFLGDWIAARFADELVNCWHMWSLCGWLGNVPKIRREGNRIRNNP